MPAGSPVGLQQLQRMQGFTWGDGGAHDFHFWIDGDTIYTDAKLTLTSGGLLVPSATITGRITALAVGASSKTLLNFVPAAESGNAYPRTTINGTGTTTAVPFTVTGLPASAVAVSLAVSWNPGAGRAVGDSVQILTNAADQHAALVVKLSDATYGQTMNGVIPCAAGATNQLTYFVAVVTGGAQWTLIVDLLGWYEPA